MASTALAYRQFETVDNTGTGAGQQWLHCLWHLYQYFFTDAEAVDSGRWRLVDSSPAAGSWSTVGNIVDNSWFVVEAQNGRQQWQAKFQASNVAALDETPAGTYRLAVNLSPGGGWVSKGGGNGGFTTSAVFDSNNKLLGGGNNSGSNDGSLIIHGDRDTVLIGISPVDADTFTSGAYVGRFEADTSKILWPTCVLTAWDGSGSPKGFDRATGGVFHSSPSGSFVLNADSPTPLEEAVSVWAPGWLNNAHQPSSFSQSYHYRPLEIASVSAPLGFLRLVYGCAGVGVLSRLDNRQLLVLHGGGANYGVAIRHNGVLP